MKTSYYLGAAAVVAAAVGVAALGRPAVATPPAPPPQLPVVPSPFPPTPAIPAIPAIPVPPPVVTPTPKLPAVPPPAAFAPMPPAPPPPAVGAPLPPPTPYTPPPRPTVGQVVLLRDGKLVEGTVTKDGDKVLVRRGVIDQPFAADQVQVVADSKDAAYRFLLAQLKADDAAGRLKLARWCMYNGMREAALAEAREVVRLRPNDGAATAMARALDESLRLFPADGSAPKPAPPAAVVPPGLPAVPPPPLTLPPPPIPPARAVAPAALPVASKFGQDAPPLPSGAPDPDHAGAAVDEFDPSVFNRAARPTK